MDPVETTVESPYSDIVAEEITPEEIQAIIKRYEHQFNMTSAELIQQVQNGTAPDMFEIMDWYSILRYQDQA